MAATDSAPWHLGLLQGPPGSGKTTVIIEIINAFLLNTDAGTDGTDTAHLTTCLITLVHLTYACGRAVTSVRVVAW